MSKQSERDWRMYVRDMLQFAQNVQSYTAGFTLLDFSSSGLNFDATVRNLELIGEAANHIPLEIRETYPNIPWRKMIATRNNLIHGYFGINYAVLWSIIQSNIPELIPQLEHLIASFDD